MADLKNKKLFQTKGYTTTSYIANVRTALTKSEIRVAELHQVVLRTSYTILVNVPLAVPIPQWH